MSSYTRLGAVIWTWKRWTALEDHGRMLYLALYTSAEAKRIVPGLFHGSITAMADAAAMPVDRTKYALDHLLEHELVEFDWDRRVTRLTELPDAGESPANGNVIRGWYRRFKDVPACEVRDAHVATLLWITEQWCREFNKVLSPKHIEAWNETFAHVTIPQRRRNGRQRLLDNDTSTPTQPGLFNSSPSRASESGTVPRTVSPSGGPTSYSEGPTSPSESDQSKEIRDSETVTVTVSQTVREPSRSGSGLGSGLGSRSLSEEGDPGEGEALATERTSGPRLVLVPAAEPFDWVLAQLAAASNGRYHPVVREGLHAALHATMRALSAAQVGPEQIAVLGSWQGLAREISTIGGDPRSRLSVWVAGEGNVLAALKAATEHEREAREASAHLAELKKQLGY